MGIMCVAYGCKNVQKKGGSSVSFHRFPHNRPEVLDIWVKRMWRDKWRPTKFSRLCSDHFTEDSYQVRPGAEHKLLKEHAVPTLFNIPVHVMDKIPEYSKQIINVTRNFSSSSINKQDIKCLESKKVAIRLKAELIKESSVETLPQSEVKRRKSSVGKVQRNNIDSFTVNSLKRKLRILQMKLMERDKIIKMLNSFIMSDKKRRQLCTCQSN